MKTHIRFLPFILVGFMMNGIYGYAQVGEARNVISVGFSGGINLNTISFDPTIKQTMHSGMTGGLCFRYTCEKYFKTLCSLQIELNYSQLGWKEDITNAYEEKIPDTYQRNIDYIQLPLLARMAWGKEEKGLMFFIFAGPQIGFVINESNERSKDWTLNPNGKPDRPNDMYQQYEMSVENKFDYGISGGLGIELNTRIGHFFLEGRYYYGLNDIFGNSKKDVFARSAHGTISAKIGYLIDLK